MGDQPCEQDEEGVRHQTRQAFVGLASVLCVAARMFSAFPLAFTASRRGGCASRAPKSNLSSVWSHIKPPRELKVSEIAFRGSDECRSGIALFAVFDGKGVAWHIQNGLPQGCS